MEQFLRGTLLLLIGCVMVGCVQQVVPDRDRITIRDYKSRQIGIDGVMTFPVVTDLNINSNTVTTTLMSDSTKSMAELKDMVMLQFLDETKADVVVEARYLVQYSGAQATIKMVARPATYRNIRQATSEDAKLFNELNELEKIKATDSPKPTTSFLNKLSN